MDYDLNSNFKIRITLDINQIIGYQVKYTLCYMITLCKKEEQFFFFYFQMLLYMNKIKIFTYKIYEK